MRHNELIHERRWEVLAAVKTADSMGALCKTLGASSGATRRALRHLGIERRWPRGPGGRGMRNDERDAAIIALREQDPPLTMQKIADQYSISRERVRQILNGRGRSDLCAEAMFRLMRYRHDANLVDWTCAHCGKPESRRRAAAKIKTCSRKCRREFQWPLETTRLALGPRILEMRENGDTWNEIGIRMGFVALHERSGGSQACRTLKLWAERVGADISHLHRSAT